MFVDFTTTASRNERKCAYSVCVSKYECAEGPVFPRSLQQYFIITARVRTHSAQIYCRTKQRSNVWPEPLTSCNSTKSYSSYNSGFHFLKPTNDHHKYIRSSNVQAHLFYCIYNLSVIKVTRLTKVS